MKENLDKMEVSEHKQIYNIIKKFIGIDKLTQTADGVLVSSDLLNDECLNEIEKYISFSIDQRKRLDEDTATRKSYERMVAN
jgi:hypothetical protein